MRYRQPSNAYAAELNRSPSVCRQFKFGAKIWSQTCQEHFRLSAFVMKVYCQAQRAVENVVDTKFHVTPTLQWLMTKHSNGNFYDVRGVRWRKMKGQLDESSPELTAFVLISFQECNGRTKGMNDTVKAAVDYLESLPNSTYTSDPYMLALTTYALGLSNSSQKYRFKDMLISARKMDGDKVYWGDTTKAVGHTNNWWTYQPANAYSVETTSYALLAYLTFNMYEDSAYIVRWLLNQRDGKLRFRTTQDTVVALQSLTEYSIHTARADVDLQVSLRPEVGKLLEFHVTNENEHVVHVADGLYNHKSKDDTIGVTVKGKGGAYLAIDLKYNIPKPAAEATCPFEVSIYIKNVTGATPLLPALMDKRECDECGICKQDPKEIDTHYDDDEFDNDDDITVSDNDKDERVHVGAVNKQAIQSNGNRPKTQDTTKDVVVQADTGSLAPLKYCIHMSISSKTTTGMAIVKFGLETSVSVDEKDLQKMETDRIIDDYETPTDQKGHIIFYIHSLGPNPIDLTFRLTDNFKGDVTSRQMATVDVYDYYQPENTCTKFYGIHRQEGEVALKFDCNDKVNRRNCKCLQSICAKPKHNDFFKKIRAPYQWLEYQLCGSNGLADYAVMVKIDNVTENTHTNYKYAKGTVQQVIHQGKEALRKRSEMQFLWRSVCNYPNLKKDKTYYVIASDGFKKTINGKDTYQYELMEEAVVFEKPAKSRKKRKGKWQIMLKRFTDKMATGCQE